MKISLNWLKKYVEIPTEVSNEELIQLIGARLVEVEGVIDETYKYDHIYIVRVETCEKIPETHLSLCRVNVGAVDSTKFEKDMDGLVQVVCGAPNVHMGMLAVWIAPGATVPASVHEDAPFVIGKRKMQGYESYGMLAGADELDFGDDHSGIVEIDPEMAQPGDRLADIFELNDLILEIENKSLTHRPDCFGVIGFAREVAGILGIKFKENEIKNDLKINNKIEVKIEDEGICSRYSALVLEKHGELKKKYLTWVDTMLSKSGMKPISPIVDATNYLMLMTGQPLHAFDYDKFVAVGGGEKSKIVVRLAREGERLELLDDTLVDLNENDIVICSNEVPVALAGAMGGKSTMIDENTKNVILESATFSLYHLRKTQMVHGIFSEAITRFTKGQPSYQTLAVAEECAEILAEGFEVTGVTDEYSQPEREVKISITVGEINSLLGTDYTQDLIVQTLMDVGFRVNETNVALEILAPEWRTDIHIKEDIIEEVGRLLGYDNIEPTLPMHGTAGKNSMFDLKRQLRDLLTRFGANEVLTYSFVSERLLHKVGQDAKNSYKIVNSISPELQYVRQSLLPNLLEKTYLNEKLPVEKFALYEMNKVYQKTWGETAEKVPVEKMQLALVVAERKNHETAYYKAKKYVDEILQYLGVKAEYVPLKSKNAEYVMFEPKRAAEIMVNGELLGVVGEFKNSVKHEFKLAEYLAGFEINLDLLMEQMLHIAKVIKFGTKKKEDVTVTTDKTYVEVARELQDKYPDAAIIPGTIYRAPGQKTRNITFHVEHNL